MLRRLPLLGLALYLAASCAIAQPDMAKSSRYYEDALARYERKDYTGAIIQLKNALQINKNQLSVQMLLGKALLETSDPVGAEVAINLALELGVSRQEAVLPLARAVVAQGQPERVLEAKVFDAAGLPPSVLHPLLLIKADAFADTGQVPKAFTATAEARTLAPNAADVWLTEAGIHLRVRAYADALNAVNRAAQLTPPTVDLLVRRASILHAMGRIPEALDAYSQALKLQPNHVEANINRIGLLIDQGRDQDASIELKALLTHQPREPRAVYLKALLAERAGDRAATKAALAQVTELIEPVPMSFLRYRPQFLMLAALAHHGQGSTAKAKPYLEAAWRYQGPTPAAKLLAQVYLQENTPDKAAEVLESYLRVAPGDPAALTMLASIHSAQGRDARATNMLREALSGRDDPMFRTALGFSLMRGGYFNDALESLEQAFRQDPKQIYAGTALVTLYMRDGQVSKAKKTVEQLVKRHPRNPSVLVLQGTVALRTEDLSLARRAFELALRERPGLTQAALGLARTDVHARNFDAARRRLLELQKADEKNLDILMDLVSLAEAEGKPKDLALWLERADASAGTRDLRPGLAQVHAQLRERQVPKALEASRRLIAKAPEDPDVLTLHAQVQLLAGDAAGARSTLTAATRRAGNQLPLLIKAAELQLQARDISGAQYTLEKVLKAAPTSLRGQALMAGIEIQQGDLAKAERRARDLIQREPKSAQGHHLLADISLARQQPAVALDSLKRAHQLEPASLTLLRLFSVQQAVEGMRAAIDTAEGWVRKHPRDTLVLKAIGDSHARQKAFDLAAKAYGRTLQVDPQDAEALNSMASVLMAQNKVTEAMALALRATRLAPGNGLYLDTLGWAEFKSGNRDQALNRLRDARLRLPQNAEIRIHLAEVLISHGRKAEARAELEAAGANTYDKALATRARTMLQTLN